MPDRFIERAREVRNRGVDADDEIEVLHESRGVGKIVQILSEILQLHLTAVTPSLPLPVR